MKKKLTLLLCTLALALGVTSCGELKNSDELAGRKVSSYRAEITNYMETLAGTTDGTPEDLIRYEFANYLLSITPQAGGMTVDDLAGMYGIDPYVVAEQFTADYELDEMEKAVDVDASAVDEYISTKLGFDLSDEKSTGATLYNDFKDCSSKAGKYKGIKDYNIEKSGKTITSTIVGDFSKRDLKMTFVYSTLDSSVPTAMNVEPVYTLGEIMKKAALNTVMGILIVFVMLVVMSAVIKGFEIIPKIEKKLKESKETAEDVRPVAAAVPVSSANNETDDLQLVAVIAAAIAASTGASTDSFVVRSIKKR